MAGQAVPAGGQMVVRMADVLAIDFGTSNTVAVAARSGEPAEPLLFDGSPLLPSAVYAQPDGTLVTGRDAVHSARLAPERFEPNPKLRIDDGAVLLGIEVTVVDLFAAVLRRVAAESASRARRPDRVVLSHPASWGPRRQQTLRSAAGLAGLADATLVPEPVAAAMRLARARREQDPAPVIVYDLGAGTFDVSVVDGSTVAATEGLADVGGLDIDSTLVAYVQATYRDRDPAAWDRLRHPGTADDRRAWRQLTDDVRAAKEMLSRTAQTFVHIPLVGVDAPITREQVEAIAEPLLARTVTATRAAIVAAGLRLPPPGPLCLVGGGSRMPLVATMLHRRFGTAPTPAEQPELVVARGALEMPSAGPAPGIAAPVAPARAAPAAPPAAAGATPGGTSRSLAGAALQSPAGAAEVSGSGVVAAPSPGADPALGAGAAGPGFSGTAGPADPSGSSPGTGGSQRSFRKHPAAVAAEYALYGVVAGVVVVAFVSIPTWLADGLGPDQVGGALLIALLIALLFGVIVPTLELVFGGDHTITVSAAGIAATERTRRGRLKTSVTVRWCDVRTVTMSRGRDANVSLQLRAARRPDPAIDQDRRYSDGRISFPLEPVVAMPLRVGPWRAPQLDAVERALVAAAGTRYRRA
ncbi:Hsp70 family protein [Actinocatenispora sera]|nr:Hsp70 family protein [Actinocatenispora sera]